MMEGTEVLEGVLRGKRRRLRKMQRVDPKVVRASALGEQIKDKRVKVEDKSFSERFE